MLTAKLIFGEKYGQQNLIGTEACSRFWLGLGIRDHWVAMAQMFTIGIAKKYSNGTKLSDALEGYSKEGSSSMLCQIMFCNKSMREIVYFLVMFQKHKWVEFRKD